MNKIKLSRTDWVILILTLTAYVPLMSGIIYRNGGGQRFSSWVMFFILDIISLIVALKTQKNYAIIIAYSTGGAAASLCLLLSGVTDWGTEDTISLICVLFSIISWIYFDLVKRNLYWATISSTLAQVIAGIPLTIETWRHPDPASALFSFCIFFIGNLLAFWTAKRWTIEDRLLTGSLVILNIIVLIPLFYKLLQ